jgi:hypothetical protein
MQILGLKGCDCSETEKGIMGIDNEMEFCPYLDINLL